jgi:hypothetical protein
MSASKRVIIDKPQPGSQYKVGQSYTMPAIAADAFIKKGDAHEFGKEDWARQQKREEEAREARAKAKEARKAALEAERKEHEGLYPLVEAKDALDLVNRRLAAAEKRKARASGKKAKEWAKTVKAIKAEQKSAEKAVAELEGPGSEPESDPLKIEMS